MCLRLQYEHMTRGGGVFSKRFSRFNYQRLRFMEKDIRVETEEVQKFI